MEVCHKLVERFGDYRSLNALEVAVLSAIAGQYSVFESELRNQFTGATCTKRENTGTGFFTSLAVDRQRSLPVFLKSPIGEIRATVDGFAGPIEFLLFMEDGYAVTLEGYTMAGDSTSNVSFDCISFVLRAWDPETGDYSF